MARTPRTAGRAQSAHPPPRPESDGNSNDAARVRAHATPSSLTWRPAASREAWRRVGRGRLSRPAHLRLRKPPNRLECTVGIVGPGTALHSRATARCPAGQPAPLQRRIYGRCAKRGASSITRHRRYASLAVPLGHKPLLLGVVVRRVVKAPCSWAGRASSGPAAGQQHSLLSTPGGPEDIYTPGQRPP